MNALVLYRIYTNTLSTPILGLQVTTHSFIRLLDIRLLKLSQNVRFSEQEKFLVVKLHLHTTVLGQQNTIGYLQRRDVQVTSDILFTGANSHYCSFVRVLGAHLGQNDTGSRMRFLDSPFHQDTVAKRSE
jgi:hypothetical protein